VLRRPTAESATPAIAWLFMIGSACFAVPSVPAVATVVPPGPLAATYFVGSLFFTSAAGLATATTPRGEAVLWWAAVVQSAGTLAFNVSTGAALWSGLTTHQENLRVWSPDFVGSICFLVASALALSAVSRGTKDWTMAALNMAGSVFFMASAIAAFVRPSTGDLLDASMANTGTLLGALCFLVAAAMLRPAPGRRVPPP
jgi:hypothetical protein